MISGRIFDAVHFLRFRRHELVHLLGCVPGSAAGHGTRVLTKLAAAAAAAAHVEAFFTGRHRCAVRRLACPPVKLIMTSPLKKKSIRTALLR